MINPLTPSLAGRVSHLIHLLRASQMPSTNHRRSRRGAGAVLRGDAQARGRRTGV